VVRCEIIHDDFHGGRPPNAHFVFVLADTEAGCTFIHNKYAGAFWARNGGKVNARRMLQSVDTKPFLFYVPFDY